MIHHSVNIYRTCTSYMRIVSTHAENNAHVRRADYSKHVRHTCTQSCMTYMAWRTCTPYMQTPFKHLRCV